MTINGWAQFFLVMAAPILLMRPLGLYLARVLAGEITLLQPLERLLFRACGIHPENEMTSRQYSMAMLTFSAVSLLATYLIERTQHWLPWNPQHLAGVAPAVAFNTAASFTTNTNWQVYTPETTMSYFTQMVGLGYHNFVSAAVGIAVAVALMRGISRKQSATLGNFWVDITRSLLWILLPLCLVIAPLLIGQGVIQNLNPYTSVTTLEHGSQLIAQGPVASQEAIKVLGTNGGGFFNANSAHPFENPTPFSNLLEMDLMLLIPAALTVTLGKMTGSPAHGRAVFAAMLVLFIAAFTAVYWAETQPHPLLHAADQQTSANMEGKEVRFGTAPSALFATITTATSSGAVDASHDSFTPLGGMVLLVNMMLGEVVFGGVGSGLYGMVIFIVLSVFIAGLMVGRTPEYLGKKIEAYDIKMAMLYVLIFPLLVLVLTAVSVLSPNALASLSNNGPHGLAEILYAYVSTAANNGSAFAGLNTNTNWYNLTLGINMLAGRFLMMVPVLALAGNLASKQSVPPSSGTFPVNGTLFTLLLVGLIVIVGALTFFPALSLGPILEHLSLHSGSSF